MTGNGTFDLNNSGNVDAGDTFLKWNAQLKVTDYITPFNQSCLLAGDVDLGSGGPLLLPSQSGTTPNELIGVGKEGRIYVVNRDNMGKFTTDPSLNCQTSEQNRTDIDKVVQELPPKTANGGVWGNFAYWNGPNGQYVYVAGSSDHLKAFSVTNGMLSTSAKSQSPESWSSGRDGLDSYVKFTVPTVANSEVFVGTKATLTIFGELPTPAHNNIGTSNDSNPSAANYDHGGYSYSAQALHGAGSGTLIFSLLQTGFLLSVTC